FQATGTTPHNTHLSTKDTVLRQAAPLVKPSPSGKWQLWAEPSVKLLNCALQGGVHVGFATVMQSGSIRSHVLIGRYCTIGQRVTFGTTGSEGNLFSDS